MIFHKKKKHSRIQSVYPSTVIYIQDMSGNCSRCILITAPAGVCQTRTKAGVGFKFKIHTHLAPSRPESPPLCMVLGTRVLETKVLVLVSSLSQKFVEKWRKKTRIS